MTPEQWNKELSRLKGAVTRAKTKAAKLPTLAEKIEAACVIAEAEDALHQHKLNYYELTAGENAQ